MINIQNALKVAGRFLGNDKINQALALSKSVNSPQSAINALSKLGNPNQIIDDGLSKINSPTALKMAAMFGANDKDLEELKNQFMSMKNHIPSTTAQTTQNQPQQQAQGNSKQQKQVGSSSRLQDLINGLK